MRNEHADDFADAILNEEDDETLGDLSSERLLMSKRMRGTETTERTDDEDSEEVEAEDFGLEGTYNLSSTYFDIFDNLLRKYVGDLNMWDNLQQELAKELGSKSIFLYQRLNSLEEKAAFDYFSKKLDKKMSNVIVLHNKTVEVDKREKLRHLMRGMYDFKFGAST